MCAIIGFKGKYDKIVLNKIFFNSRIRGLHSFGFAYYDANNALQTFKTLDYNTFIDSINKIAPDLFIAHFRYSTSGDYKILENNQPLTENDIAIAFNGVISQKTKDEMENEFEMKLKSDNDGYILLNKYQEVEFTKKQNISFAMIGLKNKKMFALRNKNRPLHIYNDNNLLIIASTKDILNRSGLYKTKQINSLIKYEL